MGVIIKDIFSYSKKIKQCVCGHNGCQGKLTYIPDDGRFSAEHLICEICYSTFAIDEKFQENIKEI